MPDATTLLGFRHLLKEQRLTEVIFETIHTRLRKRDLMLATGTVAYETIIAATDKNRHPARDPEMHQTKKAH